MRSMEVDEEIEGMVVEVEDIIVEVGAEVVSAIVGSTQLWIEVALIP